MTTYIKNDAVIMEVKQMPLEELVLNGEQIFSDIKFRRMKPVWDQGDFGEEFYDKILINEIIIQIIKKKRGIDFCNTTGLYEVTEHIVKKRGTIIKAAEDCYNFCQSCFTEYERLMCSFCSFDELIDYFISYIDGK